MNDYVSKRAGRKDPVSQRPARPRAGRKPKLLRGFIVAALAVAAVPAAAQATAPGRNGRIAYPRYSKDGNRERIETVRPNGRGAMTLTDPRNG